MKKVLAINSGSSSFKYKLFSLPDERVIASGMADRVGLDHSTFSIKLADGTKHKVEAAIPDQETAVKLLLKYLPEYHVIANLDEIAGVGHRVVAGGEFFEDSTIIDKDNIGKIKALKEYAPLHNPSEAAGIEAFLKLLPNVPQVGVFDTSFHHTLDPVHYLYPVPYEWYEKYHARKYGAHGTSVKYVINRAAKMLKQDLKDLKLIVCHLGSGASVTAIKDGKSYDTSMGFSPLAGIMMATRSGDVDPSLLEYVMEKENLNMTQIIKILNTKSGLLGVSGISPDMRDLKHNSNPRAQLARKMFINRIVRYIGAYVAELAGVDAIVFTAGIGEHDSGVKDAVMKQLEYLGIDPDYQADENNGEQFITNPDSKVKVLNIPTNEELLIERDVVRLAHLD